MQVSNENDIFQNDHSKQKKNCLKDNEEVKEKDYFEMQKIIKDHERCDSYINEEEKTNNEELENSPKLALKEKFMAKLEENEDMKNEEMFFLKNINTGKVYDIRNNEIIQNLTSKISKIGINDKEKAWQEYWKIIKKNQDKLFDAAETGNANDVEILLDKIKNPYPIDINAKGLDGWTALHFASNEGNKEVVSALLRHKVNLEAITNMGRRALHIATIRGNYEVVKFLILAKAEINCQDAESYTPLHYASENGHEKILNMLLQQKPDMKLKNFQGMYAIDLCLNIKIREIFDSFGCDVIAEEEHYGRTAFGNCILSNSRADHVGKFLMWGMQNRQKQISEPIQKAALEVDKFEQISEEKSDSKKANDKNSQEKLKNMKISKIRINNSEEKLSPESFIFYKLLGKGSFGEVYLVQLKSSTAFYAMKVLQKDKIINQNLVRYAKAERDVLSIVNHPFMVKLNFAFQNESKLFLVMDYCSGGDLGKLLCKKKKLTEELARIYICEVLLALEALHKAMIIFRDLKPDNVVLDEEGHALLTDFGLSKQGMENNLTNSFCGSVAYLAPEILFKAGHSRMVDWYLLGVMMYELLVGIPPYYSHNRDELFENIKKGPLAMPKALSEEAKSLITKLLRRNPDQRLGFKGDSEEIKRHPWFKDVNWDDVYNRRLKPPLPVKKQFNLDSPLKLKFNEGPRKKDNHIKNWTFVGNPDESEENKKGN